MRVSCSAYYDWCKHPGAIIGAETLHLHRLMKALFKQSRQSLGSREMIKKLREEGITIGRYKVRPSRLGKSVSAVILWRLTC